MSGRVVTLDARRPRAHALAALVLAVGWVACDAGSDAPRPAAHRDEPTREEPAHEEPARDEPAHEEPARPPAGTTPLPVDATRAMATLSEDESASVCAWLVENAPHRSVECEGGPTLEVGVGRDEGCPPAVAFAGCTLTVGETTSCMAQNARDPCAHGMFGAPACAPFRACMLVQMGAIAVPSE